MPIIPADFPTLEKQLSPERLARYRLAMAGNLEKAMHLYHWNMAVAEAFYSPLQTLEVIVRNALGDKLKSAFGHQWYLANNVQYLRYPQPEMLAAAISELSRRNAAIDHGRIVAELNFGFWAGLLGKRYETNLWRPLFRHAFPNAPKPFLRKNVHEPLETLRLFRNRIAHHEPIFNRALTDDHSSILQLIGWISPEAALWTAQTSRVPIVLQQRP